MGEALLEYFSVDEIYEHVLLQGGRPAAAAAVLMVEYKRRKLIHLGFRPDQVDRELRCASGNIESAADALFWATEQV